MIAINNPNFTAGLSNSFYKIRGSSMSVVMDFLEDGYKETVVIPAEEGKNGELTVEYRPCVVMQVSKVIDAVDRGEEVYVSTAIPICASQIVSWSLKNAAGTPVPCTKENLSRVSRDLLLKLFDVVIFGKKPTGEQNDTEGDLKN